MLRRRLRRRRDVITFEMAAVAISVVVTSLLTGTPSVCFQLLLKMSLVGKGSQVAPKVFRSSQLILLSRLGQFLP